jgi:hypothetical protein
VRGAQVVIDLNGGPFLPHASLRADDARGGLRERRR